MSDSVTNSKRGFRKAAIRAGAAPLAGRYYTDQAVFAEEQERIFARDWTCIGRAERIERPGHYVLAEVAGESLIVVRSTEDRVAHAFYNVCRHRGTRLCSQASGQLDSTIRCPYHAWSYDLAGRLKSAPNMRDCVDFDQGAHALISAELAEWEGFLFVSLDPTPRPFAQHVAPVVGRFQAWDLPNLRVARQIDYDVQSNWKQIVENFSECYHCPSIHPQLCRLSPATSGRNDLSEGPFLGGYSTLIRPGGSLTTSGETKRPPLGTVRGENLGRVYYYAIFPNLLLSLLPDYVMMHTLWPRDAGNTRVECAWLFDPEAMKAPEFDPSDAVDFWDLTNRQDWEVCEQSQLGTRSRAYKPGPYSNAEGLLHAFDQEYLRRMVAAETGATASMA